MIRLLVELDPGVEPIAGVVRQPPSGAPLRFVGWLQLTQTLEALRNATTQRSTSCDSHRECDPPNREVT